MVRKINFLLGVFWFITGMCGYAQIESGGQISLLPGMDTAASLQSLHHAQEISLKYPDSAIVICRNVLRQSLGSGYTPGIISAHVGLGMLAIQKGDYYQGLMHYHRALSYCDTGRYAGYYANIYSNIGTAYTYLDRYEDAARAFYRAMFYVEKYPGGLSAGYVYNNLGTLLAGRGQSGPALVYLNKALKNEIQDSQRSAIVRSGALINIGNIYFRDGKTDSAFYYIDSAIFLQRRLGLREGLNKSLVNLGLLYLEEGKADAALIVLQEAKSLAEQYQVNPYHYNTIIRTIGMAYMVRNDFKAAERYLLQAMQSGAMIPRERQIVMERLSMVYMETDRYREGWQQLYDSYRLKDSLRDQETTFRILELETRYSTVQKDRELLRNQLQMKAQEQQISRKNTWIILITASGGLIVLAALMWYRYRRRKEKSEYEIQRLKDVLEGEEKERKRLARDLHDGVNSQLTAIKSFLLAVQQSHPGLVDSNDFIQAKEMLSETSSDIRRVAHNLAPDDLMQKGLAVAVGEFCEGIFYGKELDTDVQVYGDFEDIPFPVVLAVYRIVQELLHNVIKHADASSVTVLLSRGENEISLVVEDNGKGMMPNGEGQKGMGLAGIYERTEALQGTITIESEPGQGTVVTVISRLDNKG